MSNQYVEQWQTALKQVGQNVVVDGDFGKKTFNASINTLSNDGYIAQPVQKNNYKTVVITAGHGGRDSGAVNGHITESHIATEMRTMISYYLRQGGIDVINDGEAHQNLPLQHAVKLIKKGDIAIEIHTNAAFDKRAKGVEALADPKDKVICQKLCGAVADVLDTPLRGDSGWKPENSGQHSRLAYVRNGGIILELFFISNSEELRKYQERKWLVAKAIADVLLNK